MAPKKATVGRFRATAIWVSPVSTPITSRAPWRTAALSRRDVRPVRLTIHGDREQRRSAVSASPPPPQKNDGQVFFLGDPLGKLRPSFADPVLLRPCRKRGEDGVRPWTDHSGQEPFGPLGGLTGDVHPHGEAVFANPQVPNHVFVFSPDGPCSGAFGDDFGHEKAARFFGGEADPTPRAAQGGEEPAPQESLDV